MAVVETLRPPAHLSERSQELWRDVVAVYDFHAHDLERLRLACEALDRCEQARAIIEQEGPIVRDRFGQTRAHPAIAIERDARIAALRGLRELGIEGDDERENQAARRGDETAQALDRAASPRSSRAWHHRPKLSGAHARR